MRIHQNEAEKKLSRYVGALVRSRRRFWDYHIDEVATPSELSQYMVEQLERGNIRFIILVRALKLMGVTYQQMESHFTAMISEGLPAGKLIDKAEAMLAKRDMGRRMTCKIKSH